LATSRTRLRQRHYGLIAEEVAKVYPELVVRGAKGQIESLQYDELIAMLLNEMQRQRRALSAQVRQLAELKASNDRLRAALAAQNAAVAARLRRLEEAAARTAMLVSPEGRWRFELSERGNTDRPMMISPTTPVHKRRPTPRAAVRLLPPRAHPHQKPY
jgi:hypothetical protein